MTTPATNADLNTEAEAISPAMRIAIDAWAKVSGVAPPAHAPAADFQAALDAYRVVIDLMLVFNPRLNQRINTTIWPQAVTYAVHNSQDVMNAGLAAAVDTYPRAVAALGVASPDLGALYTQMRDGLARPLYGIASGSYPNLVWLVIHKLFRHTAFVKDKWGLPTIYPLAGN